MSSAGTEDDFWLFGYGSLIWKPPPHFGRREFAIPLGLQQGLTVRLDQRIPGYIEGYVRRFWQASEDHRGTPKAPGRVVTLIDRAHYDTLVDHHFSAPNERVWGAAYHIIPTKVAEVKEYLDIREINGYSIQFTPFHPAASARHGVINCLVYIGLPNNPQFMGPQEPQRLAEHILRSKGPSGQNREYLYMLKEALDGLDNSLSRDEHINNLVARCKRLEAEGGWEVETGAKLTSGGHVLHKVGSTEEQEEVEKDIRAGQSRNPARPCRAAQTLAQTKDSIPFSY